MTPRLYRLARRTGRIAFYLGAIALVLLVAVYVTARAFLPDIATRKAELEAFLTEKAGQPVRIDLLEAHWDGIFPGAHVLGVAVLGPDGRPSVRLAEAHLTLKLLPLLKRELRIHRLVLTRPALTLERTAEGRFRLVGFAFDEVRPDGEDVFTPWLFAQGRVEVREGEIRFLDALDPGGPVRLSHVNLSLYNSGERHRLEAAASFPKAMCHDCALRADIDGNPLAGTDWSGEVYVQTQGLDLESLPAVVRERLPPELRGRFDVRMWTDWDAGRPRAVRGQAAVSDLRLPIAGFASPVSVREATGDVLWKRSGDGWLLDLRELALGLNTTPWSVGRLRLEYAPGESSLSVAHVNLDDLSGFVSALKGEHALLARWSDIHPMGTIDDLEAEIEGPLAAPTAYSAKAKLSNVSATAYEAIPGLRNVSGRVELTEAGGELALDSHDFAFDLPRVFRAPINAERASGQLQWARADGGWRIEGTDLAVQAEHGKGEGTLLFELPRDRTRSPVLRLRVDFREGDGRHAARYFPVRHLPPRVLAWMESSFLGGEITKGYLVYDGPVREFPFKQGQGRFELRGHVRDASYRYLPGWTPVTEAEVDVAIDGPAVRVTGRGRIGELVATDVDVDVRPGEEGYTARVQGEANGTVSGALAVLQAIEPAPRWRADLPEGLQATGIGTLNLDVRVPLGKPGYALTGTYRVEGAGLALASGFAAQQTNGEVRFTEAGIEAANLAGRLLGGPAKIAAERRGAHIWVQASGEAEAGELLRGQDKFRERVGGVLPWSFALEEQGGRERLRFEASLAKLKSSLPAPLDRPDGFGEDRLVIQTEQARSDQHVLGLHAGRLLSGKLVFQPDKNSWRFARGELGVGREAALPRDPGLRLNTRLDALDVDAWLPLLEGAGRHGAPPSLASVSADVRQFDMLDRRWGRLALDLKRAGNNWRGTIDGDSAAGRVVYGPAQGKSPASAATSRFELDLGFLRMPAKKQGARDTPVDPWRLPMLELRARSFEYQERKLGAFEISAAPSERSWRVARVQLSRPEMVLTASGEWSGRAERQSSNVHVEFASRDMGATLAAFGMPGQMEGGGAKIEAQLAWPGSPSNPRLAGLNGHVRVDADKGRFLQLDPGAARLFGLLELRSIARYLTLDFSPAFGRGFAYDQIRGDLSIEHGNAYTENLSLAGPTLALAVRGRVGLAAEDYDLALEASPKVSDTLTLTSWGLFGPQVAAAVLALQKVFKKQIAAGTRVTYVVRGPWDNPSINRVRREGNEPNGSGDPVTE